jgi:hypothetical protein
MTSSRQSLFVGQSVSFSSAGYSSQLSHAILKAISCLTQFLRQQAFLQSSLFFLNPACVALILTSALAAFCFLAWLRLFASMQVVAFFVERWSRLVNCSNCSQRAASDVPRGY